MEEINSETPFVPAPTPEKQSSRSWILWSFLIFHALCAVAVVALLWKVGPSVESPSFMHSSKRLLSVSREAGVGWISIHGPIYHSSSGRPWERGVEQWSRRIASMADKKEVKALVIDINSPGGSVGAVQELYDVIRRVRDEKHKPVVAVVGDVAASGGYYLAAACDKIVAQPGSLLGSIGVIFNTMNVQGLFSKIGLKSDPIKSGKMKDIGSPTRPMTQEEKDLLQGIIDNAYEQFLTAVVKGRGMEEARIRPVADGRILTGQQALAAGLVDIMGGAREATSLAGKLGGLPGDKPPKIIREGDSFESVLELLDSKFNGILRVGSLLGRELTDWNHLGLEYRWTGF